MVEKNKLFVGNLDGRVKWFHLKEFFSKYGEVTYTKVVFDRETKRSRGFWFIVFATDDDAAKALETANGVSIELPEASFLDRPVRLMYAEASEDRVIKTEEYKEESADKTIEQTEEDENLF